MYERGKHGIHLMQQAALFSASVFGNEFRLNYNKCTLCIAPAQTVCGTHDTSQ